MRNKILAIIIGIIGLFSIGSFIYYIITADKMIGLISVLFFAVVIITGIFVPLYTPTDVGENKLNGGSYQNGNE